MSCLDLISGFEFVIVFSFYISNHCIFNNKEYRLSIHKREFKVVITFELSVIIASSTSSFAK
jgi:hypothetical protein